MQLLDRAAVGLSWLASLRPELIWGLLSRGLGLVYLVAFVSLASQVLAIAGSRGITPVAQSLRAIERDFPSYKRFFYFPTLLWFGASDAMLVALPRIGALAALSIVWGGPHVHWAFAACYVAYLSLDRAFTLVYPWDCLLLEAGLWAALLPVTHMLPQLGCVAPPLPALAWLYRILVFRVVLGFGKQKFVGKTARDNGFLKGFLINQPLPTPLGWYAYHLPIWVHKAGLRIMFIIEVLLPAAAFIPGWWSITSAIAIIVLMLVIASTGNFGFFNLLTIVLTLSWLDSQTALAFHFSQVVALDANLWMHVPIALHTVGALLSFPFNSFCAHSWTLWPAWERIRYARYPVRLLRALHPWRWLHAYGVFPPQAPPPIKLVPVIEVSWDEREWTTLTHRHSPTLETSAPTFCAPHHERFDQAVVYEAYGVNEANLLRTGTGRFDPYGHGGTSAARAFVRRVLDGDIPGTHFYDRSVQAKQGPPRAARVRTYMLEPTTLAVKRQTGRYWTRTLVGPHFPVVRATDPHLSTLPHPEQWNFDDVVWLRRSYVGALMDAAARGEDVHTLVLSGAKPAAHSGIEALDLERFWDAFIPSLASEVGSDWSRMHELVERVRADYDFAQLARFERVLGRYGALLYARLEPLWAEAGVAPAFGGPLPRLPVKNGYELRLLCHLIVSRGRSTFDAVVAEPTLAIGHAETATIADGNFLLSVLRYETSVYQAQKLRLVLSQSERAGVPPKPVEPGTPAYKLERMVRHLCGPIEQIEYFKDRHTSAADVLDVPERWPRFTVSDSGVVSRLTTSE